MRRRGPGPTERVPAVPARAAHPERCVEACYLQPTRFESIAERKLRRCQLSEDGNVEISGRDLRKAPGGNCTDRRGLSQIDGGPHSMRCGTASSALTGACGTGLPWARGLERGSGRWRLIHLVQCDNLS
jgi:hypothetical protein